MNRGFLASAFALLAAGGLALAQAPAPTALDTAAHQPLILVSDPPPSRPGHVDVLPSPHPDACPGAGCYQPCAPGCEVCGPPGRFWASAEYLLWWIKDTQLPPLVTAGAAGAPVGTAGVLGPGTTVIAGGSDLEHQTLSGGRFTLGFWLNECHTFGVEGSYFFLGSRTENITATGTGGPGSAILARPFFNVLTGREDAELVSFPGLLAGTVHVSTNSRLQGAEANALCNLCCACYGRVDFIGGVRYLELNEGLRISEDLTLEPGVPGAGTTISVADQFNTSNRFYGGQAGARAEYWRGRLFANVRGVVALGETHEVVGIDGATAITPPGGATTLRRGGLLAQSTNSGRFSRDEFAVVPEIGVNVGYQVTPRVRAFVGYTFLYWSDVVRPGDQIDRSINPTQIPSNLTPGTLVGPARPAFNFNSTDFWAQGVNFGVEFRY